jgi:hypothetical protein
MTLFYLDTIWISDSKRKCGLLILNEEKLIWKQIKKIRFIEIDKNFIHRFTINDDNVYCLVCMIKPNFFLHINGIIKESYFLLNFICKKILGKMVFLKKCLVDLSPRKLFFVVPKIIDNEMKNIKMSTQVFFARENGYLFQKASKTKGDSFFLNHLKKDIYIYSINILFQKNKKSFDNFFSKNNGNLLNSIIVFREKFLIKNLFFNFTEKKPIFFRLNCDLFDIKFKSQEIIKIRLNSNFLNSDKLICIIFKTNFHAVSKITNVLEILDRFNCYLISNVIDQKFYPKNNAFYSTRYNWVKILIYLHQYVSIPISFKNVFVV